MSKQPRTPESAERAAAGRPSAEAQERLWDQVADWCEATAHRLRAGDWDHLLDDMQQALHVVAVTGQGLPWRPREFRVVRDRQANQLTLTVVLERPVRNCEPKERA